MPARISDDSWWHHYYRVDVPVPAGKSTIERLRIETGRRATAIPDTVSTEAGTLIDVNQNNAVSPFGVTGRDDVLSYKITLPNGDVVFLNVTEPNHAAHPGVVMQFVAKDNEGNLSIITVGEGTAVLQNIFDPSNTQATELWEQNSRNIIERAERDSESEDKE